MKEIIKKYRKYLFISIAVCIIVFALLALVDVGFSSETANFFEKKVIDSTLGDIFIIAVIIVFVNVLYR